MSTNDAKLLVTGSYSLKYQLLEQERLRRLQVEHKDCNKAQRERAHLLSKQTQLRRRALEEKKQAMALAEEERRKRALEERRKQQREATERFRTALSRQNKVMRTPPPTIDVPHLTIKPLKHTKPIINRHINRIVLGKEVEVTPVTTNTAAAVNRGDTPTLEQVLETVRGQQQLPDTTTSMESILLSPELIPEAIPLQQLDTREDISTDSSIISICDDSLDTVDIDETSTDNNQHEETIKIDTVIQKKGILKKLSSSGASGTEKRVRFSDTIEQHRTNSLIIPRLSLSKGNTSIISTSVTKLGFNGVRNGITIHIPNTMTEHCPQRASNLWTHITSHVPNNHDRIKRYHQPVKLWKRQTKANEAGDISCEERRLMESIELINSKLRSIPTTSRTEQPLLVRSQTSNNQLLRKTTQPYRTYY